MIAKGPCESALVLDITTNLPLRAASQHRVRSFLGETKAAVGGSGKGTPLCMAPLICENAPTVEKKLLQVFGEKVSGYEK